MLCCWMFFSTSTHKSCYAAGCSLALPHIRHATLLDSLALPHIRHAMLLDVLLHFQKRVFFRRNPRRTKLHFRVCKTLNFPLLRLPFQRICTKNSAQKNKNVQIATVSIIVLGLCDVTTDTASYRRCYHVFGICDCGLCWWPPFINQNDEEVGVARENLLRKYR